MSTHTDVEKGYSHAAHNNNAEASGAYRLAPSANPPFRQLANPGPLGAWRVLNPPPLRCFRTRLVTFLTSYCLNRSLRLRRDHLRTLFGEQSSPLHVVQHTDRGSQINISARDVTVVSGRPSFSSAHGDDNSLTPPSLPGNM
jgi:hypothetical protein